MTPTWDEAFPEHSAVSNLMAEMFLRGYLTGEQMDELEKANRELMKKDGLDKNISMESRADRERVREIAVTLKEKITEMCTDPDIKEWIKKAYIFHLKEVNPNAMGRDLN